jgi:hypothetical protein
MMSGTTAAPPAASAPSSAPLGAASANGAIGGTSSGIVGEAGSPPPLSPNTYNNSPFQTTPTSGATPQPTPY